MSNLQTKTKQQFRATFTLIDTKVTPNERYLGSITGPSIHALQNHVKALLPDGGRSVLVDEKSVENNAYMYCPEIFGGKEPFAWISEANPPANLSADSMVSAISENRTSSGR